MTRTTIANSTQFAMLSQMPNNATTAHHSTSIRHHSAPSPPPFSSSPNIATNRPRRLSLSHTHISRIKTSRPVTLLGRNPRAPCSRLIKCVAFAAVLTAGSMPGLRARVATTTWGQKRDGNIPTSSTLAHTNQHAGGWRERCARDDEAARFSWRSGETQPLISLTLVDTHVYTPSTASAPCAHNESV